MLRHAAGHRMQCKYASLLLVNCLCKSLIIKKARAVQEQDFRLYRQQSDALQGKQPEVHDYPGARCVAAESIISQLATYGNPFSADGSPRDLLTGR